MEWFFRHRSVARNDGKSARINLILESTTKLKSKICSQRKVRPLWCELTGRSMHPVFDKESIYMQLIWKSVSKCRCGESKQRKNFSSHSEIEFQKMFCRWIPYEILRSITHHLSLLSVCHLPVTSIQSWWKLSTSSVHPIESFQMEFPFRPKYWNFWAENRCTHRINFQQHNMFKKSFSMKMAKFYTQKSLWGSILLFKRQ